MENVLQTLAGQYTQQLALMMAAIAVEMCIRDRCWGISSAGMPMPRY